MAKAIFSFIVYIVVGLMTLGVIQLEPMSEWWWNILPIAIIMFAVCFLVEDIIEYKTNKETISKEFLSESEEMTKEAVSIIEQTLLKIRDSKMSKEEKKEQAIKQLCILLNYLDYKYIVEKYKEIINQ